jgi:hypothetical protein
VLRDVSWQVALTDALQQQTSDADDARKQQLQLQLQVQQLQLQLDAALGSARDSNQALADAEQRHTQQQHQQQQQQQQMEQQQQQQMEQLQHERLLERKMLLDEIHSIRSADDAGES